MIRPDLSSIPDYVPGKAYPNIIKCSSNESNLPPLPSVQKALIDAVSNLNRYPDMGAVEVRKALADSLNREAARDGLNTPELTMDNIAVGTGSSALCLQSVEATCHNGDEVIFPWLSFEAYPLFAQIVGAVPVMVPLDKDFKNDLSSMLNAITDRTRLIFVCNPNNPTGTTVNSAEFENFMKQVPEEIQVILDEAYIEYDTTNSPDSLVELTKYPNLAVMRTFSKAYGLAGARLGYTFGHTDFITALNKVAVPFSVSPIAQVAGIASTTPQAQEELQERIQATSKQRDRVTAMLPEALQVPSQTNFIWLPVAQKAARLGDDLFEQGISTRPFPGFGLRITITDEAETDQVVKALQALGDLSKYEDE